MVDVRYAMMGSIVTRVGSVMSVWMAVVNAKTVFHAQHAMMTSSLSHQTTHVDHSLNLEISA